MVGEYRQRLQTRLYELQQVRERMKQMEAVSSVGPTNPLAQRVEDLQQEVHLLTHRIEKMTKAKNSMSLTSSHIVLRFHEFARMPNKGQPTANDWHELSNTVETLFPSFCLTLKEKAQIDEMEYRVCLLVKAGMRPSDIDILLNWKHEYSSTVRKRLCKKIFQYNGSASDFDKRINDMI